MKSLNVLKKVILILLILSFMISCFGNTQGIIQNSITPHLKPQPLKPVFESEQRKEQIIELLKQDKIKVTGILDNEILLLIGTVKISLSLRKGGVLYFIENVNYTNGAEKFINNANKNYINNNFAANKIFYDKLKNKKERFIFAIEKQASSKEKKLMNKSKQKKKKDPKQKKTNLEYEEDLPGDPLKENIILKTILTIQTLDDRTGFEVGKIDNSAMRVLMHEKKFKKKENTMRSLLNIDRPIYENIIMSTQLIKKKFEYFKMNKNKNSLDEKNIDSIFKLVKENSARVIKLKKGTLIEKIIPIRLKTRVIVICITKPKDQDKNDIECYSFYAKSDIADYAPFSMEF